MAIALVGVIGTLLGTVLGWLLNRQSIKTQREHEDRTRFHELRLSLYSQMLLASDTVTQTAWQWKFAGANDTGDGGLDWAAVDSDERSRVESALETVRRLASEIELATSDQLVQDTANVLAIQAEVIRQQFVHYPVTVALEADSLLSTRQQFHEQARRELGLPELEPTADLC